MAGDLVTTSILFLVSGLPFLVCGYLVAIKKQTSIIAGWDDSLIRDSNSYANVFGWAGMVLGVLLGVAAYLYSANVVSIVVFTSLVIVASIAQLLVGGFCKSRYGK